MTNQYLEINFRVKTNESFVHDSVGWVPIFCEENNFSFEQHLIYRSCTRLSKWKEKIVVFYEENILYSSSEEESNEMERS